MTADLASIGRRVVIATHRRSGTHLAIDLLRRQFDACASTKRLGERSDALYLNLDIVGGELTEDEAADRLRRAPRPIVKTHALLELLASDGPRRAFAEQVLADADLLCVHRDGRDVLCSLHLYMQAYDPGARVPIGEFIRQEIDGRSRVAHWAEQVRGLLALPGAHAFAYRDFVDAPRETLDRLAAVLDLEPLYVEPLLPRAQTSRWQALAARFWTRPERTSIPGDPSGRARPLRWREAFSAEDHTFLSEQAEGLLGELGYDAR